MRILNVISRISGFKQKSFFITLLGISIAIAAFLTTYNYVNNEFSYDKFHENTDRIYRIVSDHYVNNEKIYTRGYCPMGMKDALNSECPEVELCARLFAVPEVIVSNDENSIKQRCIFKAEHEFLSFFKLDFLYGNSTQSLLNPNEVIISESMWRFFFNKENPLDKKLTLSVNGLKSNDYFVKGVFKDVPKNSHIQFDFLFSFHDIQNNPYFKYNPWDMDILIHYVKLDKVTSRENFIEKLKDIYSLNAEEINKARNSYSEYTLQNIEDIYLHSKGYEIDPGPRGNYLFVLCMFIISIFLLFIAWINYFNFYSINLFAKFKEIDIRRYLGASKKDILFLFCKEGVIYSFIGMTISMILIIPFQQIFNKIFNINQDFIDLFRYDFIVVVLIIFVSSIIISSLVPFIYLYIGKMKPEGIKNRSSLKYLVAIQIFLSITGISGSMLINRQVDFMLDKDIGINMEGVIAVNLPFVQNESQELNSNIDFFVEDICNNPSVPYASNTSSIPGYLYPSMINVVGDGELSNKEISLRRFWTDHNYIKVLGIELLAGRNFNEVKINEQNNIILNEKAIKLLRINSPKEAVGMTIKVGSDKLKIIGVIKDYNHFSVNNPISPVAIYYNNDKYDGYFLFKLKDKEGIEIIRKSWAKLFPGNPYNYVFLNDYYNESYVEKQRFQKTFWLFTIISIIVCSFGVFTLVSYIISKSKKEIAVRKVFGAGSYRIFLSIVGSLIKIVLVTSIISIIVSYYLFVNKWLLGFPEKVDVGVWFYLYPVVIDAGIVLVTILWQSIKASKINPCILLRYE